MLLTVLETAINKYLELDPETITRLAELDGKVVKIEINDWKLSFFVLPTRHGLQLLSAYSGPVNATLRGNINDYIKAARAGNSTSKIFNTVSIDGDSNLGNEMRDIFNRIDIDWEEHLSKLTGDAAAHSMVTGLKSLADFAKSTADNLQQQFKHYIYGEAQCFPTQTELKHFYKEVSQLRLSVDRLEAKIKKLQHD